MIGCSPLWVAALAAGAGGAAASPVSLVDAATSYINPALTYARAGAIYARQSDGTLLATPANTPPRVYDATLGWHYRCEPGWTQMALQTHTLSNASWSKTNTTVPNQNGTGPNGVADSWAVIEDTTAAASHSLKQSMAFTNGVTYCFTAVASPRSGDRYLQFFAQSAAFGSNCIATFDLATGTSAKNAAAGSAGTVQLANGNWLCWMVCTASVTTSAEIQLRLSDSSAATAASYTGNGTSGINVWCVNATASPAWLPLSTATTSTVAIGDASWTATLAGLGITLDSGYTLGAEAFYRAGTWAGAHRILLLDDDTAANRVALMRASTTATDGGLVTSASSDVYSPTAIGAFSSLRKTALRVAVNDQRLCVNGTLATASGTAAMPVGLTHARLGHGPSASNLLAGGISKAWILAAAANDAQLQALTA